MTYLFLSKAGILVLELEQSVVYIFSISDSDCSLRIFTKFRDPESGNLYVTDGYPLAHFVIFYVFVEANLDYKVTFAELILSLAR